MGEQQAEGKPVAPCQNKYLHSDHCPQGGSELGLNGVGNLYLPTSSLSICFSILEAFLSRHTRITPSTYVYTPFISDLVLAKSIAVGKMPRQTLLFDRLLYGRILHGHVAIITKPSPHYILTKSTTSGP